MRCGREQPTTQPPEIPLAAQPASSSSDAWASLALLAATTAALLVANSALYDPYQAALGFRIQLGAGGHAVDYTVKDWIKNGLMAVFFLFVGLEIKAEFREGALADARRAALPLAGALGGLLTPALIYLGITAGYPAYRDGWAIPAATDIAFAVGVLGLLGRRVPPALKAFLLAVAVIDDLAAILIIAAFYTESIHFGPLAWSGGVLLVLTALNLAGVARLAPYIVAGAVLWWCVLQSGVNPTLAGVLAALFVPMRAKAAPGGDTPAARHSPLHTLERLLKPAVLFGIMPIFAFANAGVSLTGHGIDDLAHPVTAGITFGLLLGKPIGITAFLWLLVRLGVGRLPEGAGWRQVIGVACVAGIGFTMSLFIGALAFTDAAVMDQVRLGVLLGSFVSACLGPALLLARRPAPA